jgi:FAD dependent oxidoreductase TIGR03364
MPSTFTSTPAVDLVVAGAGIVGLSVAYEAVERGLSVAVVERDARPVGASIRNFGHGCVTAQTGAALGYGLAARQRWLDLRDRAGLWVQECGTVVVARTEEELAVLREFTAQGDEHGRLLDRDGVLSRVPVAERGLLGGAFLPLDVRVDPRQAVGALAEHLAERGVELHFSTAALGAEPGVLHTSRGEIRAAAVVLALGHDLDRLLPAEAAAAEVTRCRLHMLRIANPTGRPIEPAVLTGTSLLRYSGFLACPASAALAARMAAEQPALVAAGVNHMLTQQPNGDLVVGDTHSYGDTPTPFADEELDDLLLEETAQLLGVPALSVRERWRGTYAWAPGREYLTTTPTEGVRAVAVTSGIGMTTALGFAPALLDDLGLLAGSCTA